MGSTWRGPAQDVIDQSKTDWVGLWSLLDATAHAAMALSLVLPLGASVDLAFAAIDLGEAREELEWVRPELTCLAPVRLGPLHLSDDVGAARVVLEQMVSAAIDLTINLGDVGGEPGELRALGRVLSKLRDSIEELARAAA